MTTVRYPTFAAFLFIATLLVAGCDSGSPNYAAECLDMAGRYTFETFEFDPDAPKFDSVSLLDRLDTARTEVQLLNSCDFSFVYAFENTAQDALITGRYTASSTMVRLDARSEDATELLKIYLDRRILLQRGEGGVLSGDFRKTIIMSDIEEGYEGVGPADGFIRVRLVRK